MVTKMTPGPWEVDVMGTMVTAYDQSMRICDIRGWGYLTGTGGLKLSAAEAVKIQKANVDAISAVPDLIEACLKTLAHTYAVVECPGCSGKENVCDVHLAQDLSNLAAIEAALKKAGAL